MPSDLSLTLHWQLINYNSPTTCRRCCRGKTQCIQWDFCQSVRGLFSCTFRSGNMFWLLFALIHQMTGQSTQYCVVYSWILQLVTPLCYWKTSVLTLTTAGQPGVAWLGGTACPRVVFCWWTHVQITVYPKLTPCLNTWLVDVAPGHPR